MKRRALHPIYYDPERDEMRVGDGPGVRICLTADPRVLDEHGDAFLELGRAVWQAQREREN